jgi:hypothetical protein
LGMGHPTRRNLGGVELARYRHSGATCNRESSRIKFRFRSQLVF